MNDEDLKKIRNLVKEEISDALVPVNRKLDAHSASLIKIESTIGGYADSYKENQRNIYRLDTRLTTAEEELAINSPEELKVPHFSE